MPFDSTTTGLRVSVAMATYNGARFILEQLNSIAAQTLLPAELVVSDDGSTDNTLDIVRAFAEQAPFPVRILDKAEWLGFADNFLFAVEQCRFDYVALSDQDDRWMPDKLAVALARMQADGSLLSLHRLMVTDEALHPLGVFEQDIRGDMRFAALELDPYATGWGNTMVFRREVAHLVPRASRPRQFERSTLLSHDTWIYVLCAALGPVSHIAEPLILYRKHGANVVGMGPNRWTDRLRRVRTFWTVPVGVHRERILFNTVFAPLLREAGRSDHPLAAAAAHAADVIDARTHLLNRRLTVHEGATMAARLAAFRHILRDRATGTGRRASGVSLAKDFALGVLGLGRHRHS